MTYLASVATAPLSAHCTWPALTAIRDRRYPPSVSATAAPNRRPSGTRGSRQFSKIGGGRQCRRLLDQPVRAHLPQNGIDEPVKLGRKLSIAHRPLQAADRVLDQDVQHAAVPA